MKLDSATPLNYYPFSKSASSIKPRNRFGSYPALTSAKPLTFSGNDNQTEDIKDLANELSNLASHPVSQKEKAAQAEKFALRLFTRLKTQEDLLKFTKLMGVQVLDEKETPWVGKFFKTIGAGAAIGFPNTIPGHPPYEFFDEIPGAPPEYEHVTRQAERESRSLMFISTKKPSFFQRFLQRFLFGGNPSMDCLRHEIYHLIQYKVGLPFKTQDHKADHDAHNIQVGLLNELAQMQSLNP